MEQRTPPPNRSISDIVNDLTHDSVNLMRQEIALAKAEVGEKASGVVKGLVGIVLGGAICIVGLFYLLQAVVYGLSEVMPEALAPWLPALLVGAAIIIAGFIMIKSGQKKMEPSHLAPTKTAESLRKDLQVVKGGLHE